MSENRTIAQVIEGGSIYRHLRPGLGVVAGLAGPGLGLGLPARGGVAHGSLPRPRPLRPHGGGGGGPGPGVPRGRPLVTHRHGHGGPGGAGPGRGLLLLLGGAGDLWGPGLRGHHLYGRVIGVTWARGMVRTLFLCKYNRVLKFLYRFCIEDILILSYVCVSFIHHSINVKIEEL